MRQSLIRAVFVGAVAMACAWQPSAAVAGEKQAATKEIFTTFGPFWDPDNLWLDTILIVASQQSGEESAFAASVAFSPAENVMLREIQLGVAYLGGRNALSVTLRNDRGGHPGTVVREFKVKDMLPWGAWPPQPTRTTVEPGQLLEAGVKYWLVLQAKHDTAIGWHLNSIDASGAMAFRIADRKGWSVEDPTLLTALRLLGD